MTEELSKEMKRVLITILNLPVLAKVTAYDCKTTMKTMYALFERGLIKRTNYNAVVWCGWERTGIEFMLTMLGRALAERLKEDGDKHYGK